MFSFLKKKKKLGEASNQDKKQGVKPADFEIDEKKIRAMPGKFLPKGKGKTNKSLVIIIGAAVLIVIVGIFIGLLYWSDSFNEMLFGKGGIEVIDEEEGLRELEGAEEGERSAFAPDGASADKVDEQDEEPIVFRKEVMEGINKKGAISFEMTEELGYLDLKVSAGLPSAGTILDEYNNEYKIIGGVYSFEPGGVRLPDEGLVIELFYDKDDLGDYFARDLQVLNWQEEPEISFLTGSIKESEEKAEVEAAVLPTGKIALGILVGQADTGEPDVGGGGMVTEAVDKDNDGLTDEEENIYGTSKDEPDSDSDGYGDGAEVLGLFNPAGEGGMPTSSLDTYIDETYNYSLYYPTSWAREEMGGVVRFISGVTGEMVQVIIQSNPSELSVLEWYLRQAPGVEISEIKTGKIKGREAVWSVDELTVYIGEGTDIYLINYNLGLEEEISFRTTFKVMSENFDFVGPAVLTYSNENYGFNLELPRTWAGYDVYEYENDWGGGLASNSLMFRLGTAYPNECNGYERCATLIIDIFDFVTWSSVRLLEGAPMMLNVSSDYVFTYRLNGVYGSDLEERLQEVGDVVGTFVFE